MATSKLVRLVPIKGVFVVGFKVPDNNKRLYVKVSDCADIAQAQVQAAATLIAQGITDARQVSADRFKQFKDAQ